MARFGACSGTGRGVVENLSPTGMCLNCKRVFTPGTVLTIDLLVDRSTYPLVGVVRWARQLPGTVAHVLPSSMGILLESPSEAYLALVRRFSGKSRKT